MDGFAGSGRGYRNSGSLFEDLQGEDEDFYVGSAVRALKVQPSFDQFIFIDQKPEYLETLNRTISGAGLDTSRCLLCRDNVNDFVPDWLDHLDRLDRAVVFLDPYGMQVDWKTVELLGGSQKVDLWLLVPLGQALLRMMPKSEPPDSWSNRLTAFLGTDDWKVEFYQKSMQETLFGPEEIIVRKATVRAVTDYLIARLKTAFYGVHDSPMILENSRGVPLYLLCFAAGNPRGAKPALKIAADLIRSGMK